MEGLRPDFSELNNCTETTQKSDLASRLTEIVDSLNFGENRMLHSLSTVEEFKSVKENGLGLDGRVSVEGTEFIASPIEGLAFDPKRLRSQVFAIMENERPVGVMTFIIAPWGYIANQRYLALEDDGLKVIDYKEIYDEGPEFLIIPAWTELLPEFRQKLSLARAGAEAFDSIIGQISSQAPRGTWIESVAQGEIAEKKEDENNKDRFERINKVRELTKNRNVGDVISFEEFLFDMESFGKNGKGSAATVHNAKRIGLKKVDGVASDDTLGPVFIKKVENS